MKGRAKSAPLLRKKAKLSEEVDVNEEDMEVCILDDIDVNGEVAVPEAVAHDPTCWPHLYSDNLRDAMFPTAVAAPEYEVIAPEEKDELKRLHRRWAAHRISITRG